MKEKKKVVLGQFFTKETIWLKKHIKEFIESSQTKIVYDPFAGAGHLLNTAKEILNYKEIIGLDVDKSLNWKNNDSLLSIPHVDNAIIITNPPYLSNYSASRKKIYKNVAKYFDNSCYDDLYLIALEKMLEVQKFVVAIIPETFINSSFKKKNLLHSITILEENPFDDTDVPVLVACFDGIEKDFHNIKVYKNDDFINSYGTLEDLRLIPNKTIKIDFNNLNGWLGVKCVDSTSPNDMIRFDFKENIDYDWKNGIKQSSRLFTLIDIDIPKSERENFIKKCNRILEKTRNETQDLIFSPFKGNMKNGQRRRRLDFQTCRAIIEKSLCQTSDF